MIPKKIHYCWFGRGEKPRLANKCIESWKKYCSDYEIIEWNEDNFDVNRHPYLKWCYDNKQWAFFSDFARLIIVNENGGVYFDTDVELIKNIDSLLDFEAFFCFENSEYVNTGEGFGSVVNHTSIKAMIDTYNALVKDTDGSYELIPCPKLNTEALIRLGLATDGKRQNICGAEILPSDFMNPYDAPTGRLIKTENTVSIHWYSKSWLKKSTIIRSQIMKPIHRIFGVDIFRRFRR